MPSPRSAVRGLCAALALAAWPAALGAAPGDPLAAELAAFEAFVAEEMARQQMPALSVAVRRGDLRWARGFGLADVENGCPAGARSSYRMASVTKPMTALAVLRLADQGRIDLDAPVERWVPGFPDRGHPITPRQLLGHLGGISHYRDYAAEGHFREPMDTRQALAVFADFPLVAEPGTAYHYTTYGFNLLGAVLEGAAGKPYGEVMRETVWEPLGMAATRLDDPRAIIPGRVRGYALADGRLVNAELVDISSRFAGGGTRSTVLDMVALGGAMLDGGLLATATVEAALTRQVTRDGHQTPYGLGWAVGSLNGHFWYGHGGSQQETRTDLTVFPGEDLVIALASNLEEADLTAFVARLRYLLFAEGWEVRVHFPRPADEVAYEALAAAYRDGLAFFDRHGRAASDDPEALAAAFAALRDATDEARFAADPQAARRAAREGVHPAAGEPWDLVGSHAAATLAAGGAAHGRYHRLGPLALFSDYARLAGVAEPLRLGAGLGERLAGWLAAWEGVWTPEMRAFRVGRGSDPATVAAFLRPRLAGAALAPDFTGELAGRVEELFLAGREAEAVALARTTQELYPESATADGLWGTVLHLTGQAAAGRRHLAQAAARDPGGFVAAGRLVAVADLLVGAGRGPAALTLLESAATIHPGEGRVFAALARRRHEAGDAAGARAALVRARELLPEDEDLRALAREVGPAVTP
jgi:CubicO group peptidase (beta-lactamase class C family)